MKYLIFGDLHGNLPALEKLLEREEDNYDFVISHGDVVNYGPWSNECVQLLEDTQNCIKLRGNHEIAFLSGDYPGTNPVAKAFFDHCYPMFKNIGKIKDYQQDVHLMHFVVQHTINDSYIYPNSDLSELNLEDDYIIGHSHYQFDRTFRGKRLINTGSLGQNRKIINLAEYVLYDDEKKDIELRSFVFDLDLVVEKMREQSYPQLCIDYYLNKKVL